MSDFKQVIVVRGDLEMSPGKLAVQVAHASIGALMVSGEENVKGWFQDGLTKKVVLKCRDLDELHEISMKEARGGDVCAYMVVDAGLTELEPRTTTCLAIGPGPSDVIDELTGSLPLYR